MTARPSPWLTTVTGWGRGGGMTGRWCFLVIRRIAWALLASAVLLVGCGAETESDGDPPALADEPARGEAEPAEPTDDVEVAPTVREHNNASYIVPEGWEDVSVEEIDESTAVWWDRYIQLRNDKHQLTVNYSGSVEEVGGMIEAGIADGHIDEQRVEAERSLAAADGSHIAGVRTLNDEETVWSTWHIAADGHVFQVAYRFPAGDEVDYDAASSFTGSLHISGPPEWALAILAQEEEEAARWAISVGPTEITNRAGYTGLLEYRLIPGTYTVDITHAPPGFADVMRVPGTIDGTYTNTTEGRESPVPIVTAYSYFPMSSSACSEILRTENVGGQRMAPVNDDYCFILTDIMTPRTTAAPGTTVSFEHARTSSSDIWHGADEVLAREASEAWSQPVGVLLVTLTDGGGWSVSAPTACEGVWVPIHSGLNSPGFGREGQATFANGPLCEG